MTGKKASVLCPYSGQEYERGNSESSPPPTGDCALDSYRIYNINIALGMWAHTLTVEDYQELIDRGWRRSGQYCYKPSLTKTCCPLYTIRCDALNLKLSKSQKKLLKRVSKFVNEGRSSKTSESYDGDSDSSADLNAGENSLFDKKINRIMEEKSGNEIPKISKIDHDQDKSSVVPVERSASRRLEAPGEVSPSPAALSQPPPVSAAAAVAVLSSESISVAAEGTCSPSTDSTERKSLKTPRPGVGLDASRPICKKAKLLRIEKKKKKLAEKNMSLDDVKRHQEPSEKTLEEFIHEGEPEDSVNKLELRLVRSSPPSRQFKDSLHIEHQVYQKYESAVHQRPLVKVSEAQFTRFLVSSPLKIRLVPAASERDLMLGVSWRLFVKYQTTVHRESPAEADYHTFHSFLVSSPLQFKTSSNGPSTGYGSFHQQYWLNGRLIAVGVIDILPRCVSSVYFFYDPDYSFLSLGTYGSLRELELVRRLGKESPGLSQYYMGYYIHTCPKMRYKARFSPSFLLCPEAYTWHPVSSCQPKLDRAKYSRFNEDIDAVSEDSFIHLNKVLVLWKQIAMPYSSYRLRAPGQLSASEDEEVTLYAQLVGRSCAERMLLYRS